MIIYRDCITNDELFTDIYKMELIDECVFRLIAKTVSETSGIDDNLIGANASAEEAAPGDVDPNVVTGVNVVLANRLIETGYGKKKEYMQHIKGYTKKVLAYLEENKPQEIDCFKNNIQGFIKKVLADFSEFQFFMGESCDADGMNILLRYEDEVPIMYFFKHGLIEEKV